MTSFRQQSGNILFMILVAIVLIAALTYAITRGEGGKSSMDREQAAIHAAKIVSFALDVKRAAENMTRSGKSESTISFAESHLTGYGTPDSAPANEVFNIAGGGASYADIPKNINNGAQWEFSGFTAAPNVGDAATPDLMLVLPNVSQAFCIAYNKKAGFADTAAIPDDTSMCLYDTTKRFAGTFATGVDINTMDTSTFPSATAPAPAACVACGSAYHAYYVLLER